jgi:glutathione peroxidase
MSLKIKSLLALALAAFVSAPKAAIPAAKDALDFKVKDIDGVDVDLGTYRGKVVLIVNTASKCGHTPQYADLQTLWTKYQDSGFVVLGFPSNDFLWQEPGSNKEIREFCSSKFHVTFPMFEKVDVKGKDQIPLYAYLTNQETKPTGKGNISWNFEKFLIGKDGVVAARFSPGTSPSDPSVVQAIEAQLAKGR